MNEARLRRADLENGALQIVTHIADQVIGPEAEVNKKERGSGTHWDGSKYSGVKTGFSYSTLCYVICDVIAGAWGKKF